MNGKFSRVGSGFVRKRGKISRRKSPTNRFKYIICALNYDSPLYFSAAGGENWNCLYKYKVDYCEGCSLSFL